MPSIYRRHFDHQVELVGFEPTSKHGMDKLSTTFSVTWFFEDRYGTTLPIYPLVFYLKL